MALSLSKLMMEKQVPKEVKKVMKKNDFEFWKRKGSGHILWKHKVTGKCLVTSATPSNKKCIMHIKCDIRKLIGVVA